MELHRARRILLCLRYGIGDVVMEAPAVEALSKSNPHARLTLLGASPALELFRDRPEIDRLERIGRWGLRHWGDPGTERQREAIRAWLAQQGFDLVLDPSHAVIAVREVLRAGEARLLDAGEFHQCEALHLGLRSTGAVNEAVRRGWGLSVAVDESWKLPVPEAREAWAEGFLRRLGPAFARPVAVSAVGSSHLKRWPARRLAQVADRLAEENGCGVLVFAGRQCREAQAVIEAMRRHDRLALVGAMHLQRIAALLGRCRLFLGNDTGLMHLAAARRTPVVAVFGPTCPEVYLPQVPAALALQGATFCPHRRRDAFGPPACLVEDRCLRSGGSGCIDEIPAAEVLACGRRLLNS